MKPKPIPFNTEMVLALLDNRKTVTRRVVKYTVNDVYGAACANGLWYEGYNPQNPPERLVEWYVKRIAKAPFCLGDILYVRETFFKYAGEYVYRASAAQQIEKAAHRHKNPSGSFPPAGVLV